VVKPNVRVPAEVVPGTKSPDTENTAARTDDTEPAVRAGKVPDVELVTSMAPAALAVLTE